MTAHQIKIIRTITNLRQEEFAKSIGIDRSTFSRYESGDRKIPEHIIKNIEKKYKSIILQFIS